MRALALAAVLLLCPAAWAEPGPGLRLEVTAAAVDALPEPRCDANDIPDTPARAIRLGDGTVQLYDSWHDNRVDSGPSLLQVRRRCAVVLTGAGRDDPGAYDDAAWIAAPWTPDGHTVWAIVHNEFHGHKRPKLCPSGKYMDCWFNALTAAVSRDGGRTFVRVRGDALVAALPYRYGQVGLGHHGYFNPSNIVTYDGAQYMFAFATRAGAQRPGNCLLRTTAVGEARSWRGWDGGGFGVTFIDPYMEEGAPEKHVCLPVAPRQLRWPVTSLVRHGVDGMFIALMQDGARGGGVYYATSRDLLRWSGPALLMPAVGPGAWTCADPAPVAYPSLLDPESADRNFSTVGSTAMLFATRFAVQDCRLSMNRALVRWPVRISAAD